MQWLSALPPSLSLSSLLKENHPTHSIHEQKKKVYWFYFTILESSGARLNPYYYYWGRHHVVKTNSALNIYACLPACLPACPSHYQMRWGFGSCKHDESKDARELVVWLRWHGDRWGGEVCELVCFERWEEWWWLWLFLDMKLGDWERDLFASISLARELQLILIFRHRTNFNQAERWLSEQRNEDQVSGCTIQTIANRLVVGIFTVSLNLLPSKSHWDNTKAGV